MATRMQQRRGTAAQWTGANPTLAAGEIGYETDTGKFKIGNGSSAWSALNYYVDANAILDGAPGVLDTLNELAAALGDDPAFFTTVATDLSDHTTATTSVHGIANTANLVTTTGNQTLTSKSLTSPNLTGVPLAPTAVTGTNTTQIATTAFVIGEIEALVGNAPNALNTLSELADALSDDANFAGTLTQLIGEKIARGGDTMLGALTLSGAPTSANHAATKQYVDDSTTAASNDLSAHNNDTTSVHGITNTADLATKTYADDAVGTHSADTT